MRWNLNTCPLCPSTAVQYYECFRCNHPVWTPTSSPCISMHRDSALVQHFAQTKVWLWLFSRIAFRHKAKNPSYYTDVRSVWSVCCAILWTMALTVLGNLCARAHCAWKMFCNSHPWIHQNVCGGSRCPNQRLLCLWLECTENILIGPGNSFCGSGHPIMHTVVDSWDRSKFVRWEKRLHPEPVLLRVHILGPTILAVSTITRALELARSRSTLPRI